jgi:hypothetical protein
VEDVLDQLCCIDVNKACGPDGIPPLLLKEAHNIICHPFAKLFNMSLLTKKILNLWKRANVLPIFQQGTKDVMGNYHPVALLSIGF